jgi:hypothetical protein
MIEPWIKDRRAGRFRRRHRAAAAEKSKNGRDSKAVSEV